MATYNVATATIANPHLLSGSFAAGDLDPINQRLYLTKTDFFSFGRTMVYDTAGTLLDSFEVAISPEGLAVDVRDENGPPYAFRDTVSTNEMNPAVFDVQANDFDVNGDPLTTEIYWDVSWGNTSVLNGDSISYLAFADYEGGDSLQYRVCDNGNPALCDSAWLVINVNNNVGVEELTGLVQIDHFPNPASSTLFLRSATGGLGTFTILDAMGRPVRTGSLQLAPNQTHGVAVSGMARGVYYFSLQTDQGKSVFKWVKQ